MGGPGIDRLLGGPGADQFVIDIPTLEPDEVLDFRPEEGDTIVLKIKKQKKNKNNIVVLPDRISVNNVQVNNHGDIRVKFDGKNGTR